MAEERAPRHLAAILAADVVGYSRLMEQDEAGTFERLRTHRKELFEPEIAKHQGRIFKLMGDGLLAEFGSVVDAVACAVALQRAMAERNAGLAKECRIDIRIGINLGDVIVEGDDRHGDGVNIAARLQQLAEPGGIAVSRTVVDHVKHKLALAFESLGEQRLKNISEPVGAYRVADRASAGARHIIMRLGRRRPAYRRSSRTLDKRRADGEVRSGLLWHDPAQSTSTDQVCYRRERRQKGPTRLSYMLGFPAYVGALCRSLIHRPYSGAFAANWHRAEYANEFERCRQSGALLCDRVITRWSSCSQHVDVGWFHPTCYNANSRHRCSRYDDSGHQ